MGLSVSHSLSATTPNDPAFEIQPKHWNSNHIYTLSAVGSEISGAFGNGGGVSFGLSADGNITAAAPAGAASPVNISAGTTSNNLASIVFGDSNGVSFGLGTGASSRSVTATVKTDYLTSQSNQNVTAANGGFAFQTLSFSNANNFSFGTSAGSAITASYTVPTVTNSSWTVSDTATSATVGRLAFTAANGITMTLSTSNNGQHTVFASYTVPTVTNSSWTVSDTATSATVGRLAFTAANGITMTLSTSNNGNHTVFASYTVPTVTNSSMSVSDAATSGTLARLAFTNLNGVTLSLSTGAGGSHTIVGSHNALTTQSTQYLAMTLAGNTAGTTTFHATNNASLFFNGGANITLSGNGSTVTIIGPTPAAGVAAGVSNTGNTAGNTGTVSSGTLVFAGSGAITASQSTAAGQSTVWYSVAAQTNQSAIKGFGVSNTGNTAGNTGISTGIDWVMAGSSPITLSQSTVGGGPDTVWVQAPATSSIVGTSGLSISTAGSTISVQPIPLSAWDPYPIISGTAVSSHAPASFWFSRMILDWDVAVSYANVLKSLNVVAPGMSSQNSSATNKFSYSHGLTLFTRQNFAGNSSNMSQWTTASFGMTGSLSQSSSSASVALSWVTNSTGGTTSFSTTSSNNSWTNFFTGMQMFRIPLVTTLTPGEYFIGQAHSSTTATVGSNFTLLSVSNLHVAPASNTFATITSSGSLAFSSPDGLGIGVASAVTTNNTMAMSVISANTQNWWYMNFSNI